MRILGLLLVFLFVNFTMFELNSYLEKQSYQEVATVEQELMDAKVYATYKTLRDSGYLDIVAWFVETQDMNFYDAITNFSTLVYLNRELTSSFREYGMKVKVYFNDTLVFDSQLENNQLPVSERLEFTGLEDYTLIRNEKVYIFPYISPYSYNFYRIVVVVGE